MRILADENVPGAVVQGLRSRHDVVWVQESAPGSPDAAVLAMAQAQDRVLLTFDKDFGELAFKAGLPATSGVILVRAAPRSPDQILALVSQTIAMSDDWPGHFSVIEDYRYRMIDLP